MHFISPRDKKLNKIIKNYRDRFCNFNYLWAITIVKNCHIIISKPWFHWFGGMFRIFVLLVDNVRSTHIKVFCIFRAFKISIYYVPATFSRILWSVPTPLTVIHPHTIMQLSPHLRIGFACHGLFSANFNTCAIARGSLYIQTKRA